MLGLNATAKDKPTRPVHDFVITVPLSSRPTTLQLSENTRLFAPGFEAIAVGKDGKIERFKPRREQFLAGVVAGVEHNSSVRIHRSDAGLLTGTIAIHDRLYMVEPAGHYGISDDMIVYESSDLAWGKQVPPGTLPCSARSPPEELGGDATGDVPRTSTARARRSAPPDGNTVCPMVLVADSHFFASQGGTLAGTTEAMLATINYADALFKSAALGSQDFGVSAKTVVIYNDAASDPYSATFASSADLLELFSAPQADGNVVHSEHCLAHLFTSHSLVGGVQGLAWVARANSEIAGICNGYGDNGRSKYYNTGFTTDTNANQRVPTLMRYLVTAHELGHNFGSLHDGEAGTSTGSCVPSDSDGGKYLMYPISVSGVDTNNNQFSSCSTGIISSVIASWGGSCFEQPAQAVCGNGLLEPAGPDGDAATTADNEECDSGDRNDGDACCDTSCKLRASAVCSDANSVCCRTCQVASASTPCYTGFENDVACKATTSCDGTNVACPTILQMPMGTTCGERGICVPNSNEALRCVHWCTQFGASRCSCDALPDSCAVCCTDAPSVTPYCAPASTWDAAAGTCVFGDNSTAPGARPFDSVCKPPPALLFESPYKDSAGQSFLQNETYLTTLSACPEGQCDGAGNCEAQEDDMISNILGQLAKISPEGFWTWTKTNIVGSSIILVGIPWLIGSCFMCRRDRKKRRARQDEYMQLMIPKRSNTFETMAENLAKK